METKPLNMQPTIRQRYKMAALTGLLACDSFDCSFKKAAEKAGEVADAMLIEDEQHAAKQREGKL